MGIKNNDDIPDNIPEEDREEFKRLRETKINDLKDNFELVDYLQAETLTCMWRIAVLGGDIVSVEASLKEGFSPNAPVDDQGKPPLVSVSRVMPQSIEEAAKLATVAKSLISHGAVLNLPDRCGLFPADHALFSPSTAIAREIVLATLRQNCQRQAARYFRPNYRAVFATIVSEKAASSWRNVLIDNIDAVRNAIASETVKGDIHLRDLPLQERAYWDTLKIPALRALPTPSVELAWAYENVAMLKDKKDKGYLITKDDIETAEDQARFQETHHCQNFRPDYT